MTNDSELPVVDEALTERCPTCGAPVKNIFEHVDQDCALEEIGRLNSQAASTPSCQKALQNLDEALEKVKMAERWYKRAPLKMDVSWELQRLQEENARLRQRVQDLERFITKAATPVSCSMQPIPTVFFNGMKVEMRSDGVYVDGEKLVPSPKREM